MAKLIVCPKCQAEQAICRDDEGKMKCVFCGEELDLPEYSEEEEFFEQQTEDVPAVQEPVGDPVCLTYVLNEDEVEDALFSSGKIGTRKIIPILETVGLSIAIIIFAIPLIGGQFGLYDKFQKPVVFDWIIFAILLALIPLIWILPSRTKKNIVKRSTTGSRLQVEIFENIARVTVNENAEESWVLTLGDYRLVETERNFIMVLKNGQILVIPKRSVKDEDLQIVSDRLKAAEEELG